MRDYGSMRVLELVGPDGTSAFGRWFESLDVFAAAKVVAATLRMERGNLASIKWFRGIGEYRIGSGPGYRIYVARETADTMLLLGGGTKKTQWRDVERSLALWDEYKRRKGKEV
jgi:putative addiction module killer protein